MTLAMHLYLCLVVCSLIPISFVSAKPAGGVASFANILLPAVSNNTARNNMWPHTDIAGVCKEIGLYDGSSIEVKGVYEATAANEGNVNVPFQVRARLYKATCANTIGDTIPEKNCGLNLGDWNYRYPTLELMAEYISPMKYATGKGEPPFYLHESWSSSFHPPGTTFTGDQPAKTESPKATTPSPAPNKNTTNSTSGEVKANGGSQGPNSASSTGKQSVFRKDGSANETNLIKPSSNSIPVQNGSAMYIIQVLIVRNLTLQTHGSGSLSVNLTLKMRNPHGYLSAVDYPALVFYGVMTAVYTIYAFAWIVMMACSYKDLVRLQFWVLAVILLGFLEKMLFVSEYGSVNTGHDPSGLIMIAELVSAVKRALSRMLLIIVAMGFGTVRPRLGDSLGKVVAIGVVYTILAVMDGIIRARNETFVSRDAASTVTLALLLIFDTFVMYWIFTAIVDTRRTLRLRKNFVKLAMYNHFSYTLMFAIVASLGFVVWSLVTLNFPAKNCLTDWKEVWLRDCFWHVLFAFILLIVMIIWRPSANRNRFAYSLVNDDEDIDEEEPEQGPNKNFDTLKMRQMTKSESEAPPTVSSQAEDDLRWVEENLPTTAMDKALPLLLDSDEEVMTTKFEISKMN